MEEKDGYKESTEKFAQRFRAWRNSQKIPMKQIAFDLKVSVSTVSAWENGTRFPSMEHLRRIAKICQVPLCAFFHVCDKKCIYLKVLQEDGA